MKKLMAMTLSLLLIVGLLLTGCSTNSTEQGDAKPVDTRKEEKILRMSLSGEPPTLDPHNGSDALSSPAINGIFEGLIRIRDGKITPGMAKSWEISEDGLTYTFHLREDAKWSDGQPLTAHDFVYGIIRLIDPNPPAPNGQYAFQGYYIVNGEKFNKGEITNPDEVAVKALDYYTLEIKLVNPIPYFLGLMDFNSFFPCRKDYVDKYGAEYTSEPSKIIGNGPFVLKEWNHEEKLVLEKNPNYWNKDEIKLDKVEIYIIGDQNTALNMFTSGDLDFINLPKDFIPQYQKEGKALFYSDGVQYWLEFNMKSKKSAGKFLKNKNFRQAIGYAIDRKNYIDGVLQDGSEPALRYVAPILAIGDQEWGEKYPLEFYTPHQDLDKAKELLNIALKEIGTTADKIPTIEFLTDDRPDRKLSGEAIQDMLLKNLGIKIDIKLVPTKQRYQLMRDGDFDIVWAGFGPDYNDPMTYLERLTSDSGLNTTGFASNEFDEYIKEAKESNDVEVRAKAMIEAEKLLLDEGPLVPVYFRTSAWVKKDNLVDLIRSGMRTDPDFVYADFK